MKLFLDTNVIIDLFMARAPFSIEALAIFDKAEKGEVKLFIAAISFNNIHYILKKDVSKKKLIRLLEDLLESVEVIPLDETLLGVALKADFKDFEDAIQNASAMSKKGINAIVTRNTKDFKKSSLPVLSPKDALALL